MQKRNVKKLSLVPVTVIFQSVSVPALVSAKTQLIFFTGSGVVVA